MFKGIEKSKEGTNPEMYPGSCVYDAGIAGYFEKVVFEARFDKSKVLTAIDSWNYDKYSNRTVLAARHEKIQLVAKALEAKTQKFDGVVYISLAYRLGFVE